MQTKDNARFDIRRISPRDWAQFGTEQIAYIRPVMVNGAQAVAIHAADGTPIGAAPDARLAIAAIIEHEMEPMLLH
ncbi:MAG: hypothetical protein V4653_13765 [Pseudomonadota bacterium]